MTEGGSLPPEGIERRKHRRYPCMLDAMFRSIGMEGPGSAEEGYIRCKAINISEGGLLLEGDAYIPEGQRLEIRVDLGEESKVIVAEAEAVHSHEKSGTFRIGVKFIKKRFVSDD